MQLRQPAGLAWLNAGERQRLQGFAHPRRAQVYLAGRWLLREALQAWGAPPSCEVDAQGRSHVPGRPGLWLSLSHSGPYLACAVADAAVGLDLECLQPRRDLLGLAALMSGPAQCQRLAGLQGDAQLQCFYRDWTLKEAWLKRQGLGLDLARMRALQTWTPQPGEAAQVLSLLDPERGLVLALAGDELLPGPEVSNGGPAWPPGLGQPQWLCCRDQSTPKSK